MPKRDISEKCRTSPTLAALTSDAERFWWRLLTMVDDYGRFEANPKVLNGTCVPLLDWTDKKVMKCLEEFAIEREPDRKPLVLYYVVKGRVYGEMVSFQEHQRKRNSIPKFPPVKSGTRIMPPLAASCRELPQVAASSVSDTDTVTPNPSASGAQSLSTRGTLRSGDNSAIRLQDRTAQDLEPIGNLSDFFRQKALEADAS